MNTIQNAANAEAGSLTAPASGSPLVSLTVTDANPAASTESNCTNIDKKECDAILEIADYAGYNIQNKNKICDGNSIFCKDNKITKIYWEHEDLNGTIHASINKLTSLQTLSLRNNKLTGNIPDLSALINLEDLYLNNNQLSGKKPDIEKLYPNIINYNLDYNIFTK